VRLDLFFCAFGGGGAKLVVSLLFSSLWGLVAIGVRMVLWGGGGFLAVELGCVLKRGFFFFKKKGKAWGFFSQELSWFTQRGVFSFSYCVYIVRLRLRVA